MREYEYDASTVIIITVRIVDLRVFRHGHHPEDPGDLAQETPV